MMTSEEYKDMYDFIGAALEVYNVLGRGLEEAVYQESLELELTMRESDFIPQHRINIWYKGIQLNKYYLADFYFKGILVELKSVDQICPDHRAQLFNYMRLCNIDRGLLINFGEKSLRTERYLYSKETDHFILLTKNNYKQYIIPPTDNKEISG